MIESDSIEIGAETTEGGVKQWLKQKSKYERTTTLEA
jgi:hypothetical protein